MSKSTCQLCLKVLGKPCYGCSKIQRTINHGFSKLNDFYDQEDREHEEKYETENFYKEYCLQVTYYIEENSHLDQDKEKENKIITKTSTNTVILPLVRFFKNKHMQKYNEIDTDCQVLNYYQKDSIKSCQSCRSYDECDLRTFYQITKANIVLAPPKITLDD